MKYFDKYKKHFDELKMAAEKVNATLHEKGFFDDSVERIIRVENELAKMTSWGFVEEIELILSNHKCKEYYPSFLVNAVLFLNNGHKEDVILEYFEEKAKLLQML